MQLLGIDIGGSGIKGALVDVESGSLVTERYRVPTPESRLPQDVLPAVAKVVRHFDYRGPIGVGYPAVVVNGVVRTAFTALNITEWIGLNVAEALQRETGHPVTVLNDADAAGIAEMRFGAGMGWSGTVIALTLGTGVGSAVFVDGKLVPNTEFGKLYLAGWDDHVEQYTAERARDTLKLSWKAWAKNLNRLLLHIDHIFSPQLFIIGGGVSKKHDKYIPRLAVDTPVVPAHLRNRAGIIGAALAAMPLTAS